MRMLFAAVLAFLLLSSPASAHLAGGADVAADGFILHFGYDPEVLRAGETSTFVLGLEKEGAAETVTPDAIWVRVSRGDAIVFVGTLAPVNDNATMQTVLPEAGEHEVLARFNVDGRQVEGRFSVTAAPATGPAAAPPPAPSRDGLPALIAVAAAVIGFLFGRASRR